MSQAFCRIHSLKEGIAYARLHLLQNRSGLQKGIDRRVPPKDFTDKISKEVFVRGKRGRLPSWKERALCSGSELLREQEAHVSQMGAKQDTGDPTIEGDGQLLGFLVGKPGQAVQCDQFG